MTNYVLIHGSYQGGWMWRDVASRLRAAGHTVFAPTLDGCGERRLGLRAGIDTTTHANEIAGPRRAYDSPVAIERLGVDVCAHRATF